MTVDERIRQAATELRAASRVGSQPPVLERRRRRPVVLALGSAVALAAAVALIVVSVLPGGGTVVSVGGPGKQGSGISPAAFSQMNRRLAEYMQAVNAADAAGAAEAGHADWWQGSIVTGPVEDDRVVVAVAAFSWDPRGTVQVLTYSSGQWHPTAYLPDPWCPCQGQPPHPSAINLSVPIQVGDVTGDGRPDFLISLTAADNTPGALLTQDGAAPGKWRYAPFSGPFPTDTKIGGSPTISGTHIVSTYNNCSPACVDGEQWPITWTYQPATGQFWAPPSVVNGPPSGTPPAASTTHVPGTLERFVPESATTWWAVVSGLGDVSSTTYVVRTTDSGRNWQQAFVSSALSGLASEAFISESVGWVADRAGIGDPLLYRTLDGGTSWQLIGSDPEGCDLQFVDELHGWCISIQGATGSETVDLRRTIDGGSTWTEISHNGPTAADATPGALPFACDKTITFISDNVGWASSSNCNGGSPYLYRTGDAGAHWSALPTIPPPPGSAQPQGGGLGTPVVQGSDVAVAEKIYGSRAVVAIATSSNGGQSWRSRLVPEVSEPYASEQWAVDPVDTTHWRLTNGTQFMATDDAGTHWRTWNLSVPLKSAEQYGAADTLDFLTPQEGWAVPSAEGGPLQWTEDGGMTWKAIRLVAGPYSISGP